MTNKLIVGIDNGVNGGIAILDQNGEMVDVQKMPIELSKETRKEYDFTELVKIFDTLEEQVHDYEISVFIEKAQPRFMDGSKQAFKTGMGYGLILGILSALGLKYTIITSQTWMKECFADYDTKTKEKKSIAWCLAKFPNENWKVSERSKKMHDGMTDACCIAYYGWLQGQKTEKIE